MTSRYSAVITVRAGDATAAIYDSVSADNDIYPENPVDTAIILKNDAKDGGSSSGGSAHMLEMTSSSDNLSHLRANLNSTLRLIQACHDAIVFSAKSAG